MKRFVLYLLGVVTILASCAKEVSEPQIKQDGNLYTIRASIKDATKTTVDNYGVFAWSDDETVAVADGTTSAKTFTIDNNQKAEGVFTYSGGDVTGNLRMAVSPSSAAAIPSTTGTTVNITLPTNYEYVPGKTNAVMVAGEPTISSGEYRFAFRHAMALIKVSYTNVPVGTKVFKLTMDKNIAGATVELDASSSEPKIEISDITGGSASKSVTVTLADAVASSSTSMTFYVPVPTGEYKTFKAQLLNASSVVLSAKNKDFGASSLELDRCDVFVTPNIDGSTGVTDVLTREFTTRPESQTYGEWSGKAGSSSSAVYAGYSAGDKNTIQLRTKNSEEGLITTTSGGVAKKVVVAWHSETAAGRTIEVYGKNSAYSSAEDLYDPSNCGESLGTIVKGSTTLDLSKEYSYIGIRSTDGALYLENIKITWVPDNRTKLDAPTFTPASSEVLIGSKISISSVAGSTVYYTTNGSTPNTSSSVYSEPIEVFDDFTLKAIAVKTGFFNSDETSEDYTVPVCATPTFSPDGSSKVASGTDVTISCGTAGATIYYTRDGSEPTTLSSSGTTVSNITTQTTIRAFATKTGYKNSAEGSVIIKIIGDVETLAEPGSVTITALSSSSFTGTWANVDNALGYEWVISTSSSSAGIVKTGEGVNVPSGGYGTFSVGSLDGTGASYDDGTSTWSLTKSISFVVGTTYYLYVKSIGDDGANYNDSDTYGASAAKTNVPAANTVLFSDTFDTAADGSSALVFYSSTGTTTAYNSVTYGTSITYTKSSGDVTVENSNNAGGTAKEIQVNKNGGSLTISGIKTYGATSVRVSFKYKCNKTAAPITATCGSTDSGSFSSTSATTATFDATLSGDTFDLVIRKSSNASSSAARFDDVQITVLE